MSGGGLGVGWIAGGALALLLLVGPLGAADARAPKGIPGSAPPAAKRAEPPLPAPAAWPFGERFSRTSGTGRYDSGAFLWTDFLHDDHGAAGPGLPGYVALLAAPNGTYRYPDGAAAMNGADVFRVGVGLAESGASVWRVDWTTLVDPDLPIAVFALDMDTDPTTGTSRWPAGAGVGSPGSDRFLIISSRGAWIVSPSQRFRRVARPGAGLEVDRGARSFVARVPARALRTRGTWRLRMVAGLAGEDGRSLRPVGSELGAGPGQPAVYDVGIKPRRTEPPVRNFWMERAQAGALARSDVTPFHADISWGALRRARTSPAPSPRGHLNRWYVSRIEASQGVTPAEEPVFGGRVQPYALYVPRSYRRGRENQLVWMLHSLEVNHNQYAALNPRYVEAACERRARLCASPLGRGPGGFYTDEAELDVWEAWAAIARDHRLDPARTIASGYSMGGYGSYKLALLYPDAFARAISLAGPPASGIGLASGVGAVAANSDTFPLLANGRHTEWFVAHGALDQLVPVTGVVQQVQEMDRLGLRYTFELYPTEDHLLYAAKDGFSTAARAMDRRAVPRNPSSFELGWYPGLVDHRLGLGSNSAWWLGGLRAARPGPAAADDEIARVGARSLARPERPVTSSTSGELILGEGGPSAPGGGLEAVLGQIGAEVGRVPDLLSSLAGSLLLDGDPALGIRVQSAWSRGERPARHPRLELELEGVRALSVDTRRAGLRPGERFRVAVRSDRRATLRLRRLAPGAPVRGAGRVSRAGRDGRAGVALPAGERVVTVGGRR